jgi:hypothetical protein
MGFIGQLGFIAVQLAAAWNSGRKDAIASRTALFTI